MSAPQPFTYRATVVRWVDGDTVILNIDLGFRSHMEADFRLIGCDTPERGHPRYAEAREFCEVLAPVGSNVIARTAKSDKYGRWLVDVIGVDPTKTVSEKLIAAGLAKPYYGGTRG